MSSVNHAQLKKHILELKARGVKNGKKIGFLIGNTAKENERQAYFCTPIREFSQIIIAGVIVYSEPEAREISCIVDGIVDYVFVDSEKKIPKQPLAEVDSVANIERAVREGITRSSFFTYKGNDLTVDSIDLLLSYLFKEKTRGLGGVKVSIVGSGNLGSKLALKMVERGANVSITRRDKSKLKFIAKALNVIKPHDTKEEVKCIYSNKEVAIGAEVLIGTTNGQPSITIEMAKLVADHAIILDAGKGTIEESALKYFNDQGMSVYRVDVTASLAGMVESQVFLDNAFQSKFGRRKYHGINIVSGGIIGKSGECVVDDISNPSVIYGVAQGDGLFKEELSSQDQKTFKRLQEYILKNDKKKISS